MKKLSLFLSRKLPYKIKEILFSSQALYLVGGAIRDFFLERENEDLDFIFLGQHFEFTFFLEKIREAGFRVIKIGKKEEIIYRIPIFDKKYLDFTLVSDGLEKDLKRRDFTINSISYHLASGKIIDVSNGISDIENRIIRANSYQVIKDDPLRILRGYRFKVQLGFKISPRTLEFFRDNVFKIEEVAIERILMELEKIFSFPCFEELYQLYKLGALTLIIPQLKELEGIAANDFHHLSLVGHTFQMIKWASFFYAENFSAFKRELNVYHQTKELMSLKEKSLENIFVKISSKLKYKEELIYAILFHDVGKKETMVYSEEKGKYVFYQHEKFSAQLFLNWSKKNRFNIEKGKRIIKLIENHMRASLFPLNSATKRAYYRLLRKIGIDLMAEFLLLALSDRLSALGPKIEVKELINYLHGIEKMISLWEEQLVQPQQPILKGRDLLENFQIKPGPLFSQILSWVDEEYQLGTVKNREEALALVAKKYNLKRKVI